MAGDSTFKHYSRTDTDNGPMRAHACRMQIAEQRLPRQRTHVE